MVSPFTIALMVGSLRRNGFSEIVAKALCDSAPSNVTFHAINIRDMPHYDVELDGAASPPAVLEGRRQIGQSDLLLIVTPEYNRGVPGVLKNAIDWLSRPAFASVLVGKPAIFASQSPSPLGGARAQSELREIMASTLCQLPTMREIIVTQVVTKITDGRLTDQPTLDFMRDSLTSVIEHVKLLSEIQNAHVVSAR